MQRAPIAYYRESDIVGQKPVTPEEAERNRSIGKGPKRPREGKLGLVPFSAATLWRKVSAGEFPAPVKLGQGITAWHAEAVHNWLNSHLKVQ
jgi:predicted DNA-binding transcriptional regulator AlpA